MVATELILGFKCCLCGRTCLGWGDKRQFGNNPSPITNEGECCDRCNWTKVIPARLDIVENVS